MNSRILQRSQQEVSKYKCSFNLYEDYEQMHLMLLESMGVAALKYKEQLEIVIQFIVSKLYSLSNSIIRFDINNDIENLNNIIDFAEHINIIIKYGDSITAEYKSNQTQIKNGKVDTVVFQFNINPIEIQTNIDLYICTIRRLLYHEITHCIEDIKRRLSGNSINYIFDNAKTNINYSKITTYMIEHSMPTNRQEEDEYDICNILYRLFIDPERNAAVNELYADLISIRNAGIDISRNNIKQTIFNETESGQDYLYFKKLLYNYKNSNDWIGICKKYVNPRILEKYSTNIKFKKWFINYLTNSLNTYFKLICKIGETYLIIENKEYNKIDKLSTKITKAISETVSFIYETCNPIQLYNHYTVYYKQNNNIYQQSVKTNIFLNQLI